METAEIEKVPRRRRPLTQAVALVLLAAFLSNCSAGTVMNSVLAGTKNWCRHDNNVCHVDDRSPRYR